MTAEVETPPRIPRRRRPASKAGADPALFSTVIRTASQAEHEAAETSTFGTDLLAGKLPIEAYAALLGQTRHVYETLEAATDVMRDNPVAGPFCFDSLRRLDAIERDLAVLAGPGWPDMFPALPATEAYCHRLREVAFDWPGGFVAHHYTRYLGDLSGGQIIRRILERTYGLTHAGVEFYIFPHIPKPKVFKDEYRALLDDAPWDDEEKDRIVDEVNAAFRHNSALFADLAGANGPSRAPQAAAT